MRKSILAAAVAVAAMAQPCYPQQAAPVQSIEVATATVAKEEPIPLPEQKNNKVSPGSFASGVAGIGIVVIGVILLAGVAFLPSS